MLPLSVQAPAAIVLFAGGTVACFGGFRLFRFVLGVYGFILGALAGSSMVGTGQAWMTLAGAVGGGAIGAIVFVAGYVVAVALVGAGVGALVANLAWKPIGGEPHVALVILAAALGALAAMWFQRHVIIVGTAFGGAWTMLVGGTALLGGRVPRPPAADAEIWATYPDVQGTPWLWVLGIWMAMSLVGMYVQLRTTTRTGARKRK